MKGNANIKENAGIVGRFRVTKFAKEGSIISQSEWKKNIVVSSDGYGRNLLARQMAGITRYSIEIDSMSLSTNNTAPANGDTSLGGTVATVPLQLNNVSSSGEANVIDLSAFFTDVDLANGTYYKVGLSMDGRLFTSALLDTPETKATGDQYRVDYQVIIN